MFCRKSTSAHLQPKETQIYLSFFLNSRIPVTAMFLNLRGEYLPHFRGIKDVCQPFAPQQSESKANLAEEQASQAPTATKPGGWCTACVSHAHNWLRGFVPEVASGLVLSLPATLTVETTQWVAADVSGWWSLMRIGLEKKNMPKALVIVSWGFIGIKHHISPHALWLESFAFPYALRARCGYWVQDHLSTGTETAGLGVGQPHCLHGMLAMDSTLASQGCILALWGLM